MMEWKANQLLHLLLVSQEDGVGSSEGEGPELSVHSEIFGTKSGNEASVEVMLGHGHLLYWEYLKHNKVKKNLGWNCIL